MEPAELGELVGIDEEAADDMIQFAEEMAAKIEEEKANMPPEEVQGRHHHQRSTPASAAAALFGEDTTPAAPTEAKPTLDSLFGPADATEAAAAETAPSGNGEAALEGADGQIAVEEPAAEGQAQEEPAATEASEAAPVPHETQG